MGKKLTRENLSILNEFRSPYPSTKGSCRCKFRGYVYNIAPLFKKREDLGLDIESRSASRTDSRIVSL